MRRAALALAFGAAFATPVAAPSPARADEPPLLRVVETLGATSDAFEAAEVGGDVWVATSGGLVIVHQGRVARVVGAMAGLPGARLRSISVTGDGVWVGGTDGAALLTPGADGGAQVVRTLALSRVRRVVDFAGSRYFATYGSGLLREDRAGHRVPVAAVGAQARVTDLVVRDARLYVATAGGGVVRLDATDRRERAWRTRDGLADDTVWDLEPAGDALLAATAGGLSVIRAGRVDADAPEARASRAWPVSDVRAVAVTPAGAIAATYGGGLQRTTAAFDAVDRARAFGVGGRGFARSLARTSAGTWVVCDGDGVYAVPPAGPAAAWIAGGLPSGDVSALAAGKDGLWIGTFDRGIALREPSGMVRSLADAAVDPRVNDLAVLAGPSRDETLYVATDAGLFAGSGSSFAKVTDPGAPPREHTSALYVDARTGDLWAAGAHGLSRRRGDRWTRWASAPGGLPDQLDSLTVDAQGNVWAGSLQGLARLEPDSGRIERRDIASGDLPVDWVTACAPWGSAVVAGTYDGGLAFLGGAEPRFVREQDGLPSGWVNPHAMRSIGGELWIGALDRGLVVGHPGAWRRLGLEGALPSADVTGVLAAGDRSAWVATRGGIARVEWRPR